MKTVTITISGPQGTYKSLLANALEEYLDNRGFIVGCTTEGDECIPDAINKIPRDAIHIEIETRNA